MNGNMNIEAGAWVQVTSAPVEAITIQNLGGGTIIVVGGAAPTDDTGIRLAPGEALSAGTPLSDVFPGIVSPMHVRVRAISRNGKVFVSHA